MPDEVFETLEDAKETVEFLMSQYGSAEDPQVYAVILKDGNKNIGYVQLVPIGEGKWEIGYHISKPYTGNGYATEAVTAFLPIMAEKSAIKEVYGIRLLENLASGRILDKCGFENFFEGEGEYHDGVYKIKAISLIREVGYDSTEAIKILDATDDRFNDAVRLLDS